MNMPKISRNRVLIMVIINVFLNLILIPKDIKIISMSLGGLGATGAAIATVISYAVGLIYTRFKAWKITNIKGNPAILLHAFAAIIMGVTLYHLSNTFLITRWYHLMSLSFFGLGIYFAVLYLLKEFTKDDFYFFIDTLNIKKMVKYIISEIKGK